jgi:ParB family transcriptional regulator, chromosome partitioning protein
MSRRRDDLKALFAGGSPAETPPSQDETSPEQKALVPQFLRGDAPSPAPAMPPPRASSGALKAMGLELDGLRQAASETERLKAQLAAASAIIEIDTALIDAAFVRDRMETDAEADQMLEASLATNGQQVPVLVRPHPAQAGRYEAVYGHRRVAALRRLGKPVRAIIRSMSDDELVIAQGQENNQRRDLSFIERARYTATLIGRGFPRSTVIAALDAHKSDLTRYVAVTDALPLAVIDAIGPAPTTGRERWMALAALMPQPVPAKVTSLLASEAFAALPSDDRIKAVTAALKVNPKPPSPAAKAWRSADGAVRVEQKGNDLRMAGAEAAAFAAFVAGELPALHKAFQERKK